MPIPDAQAGPKEIELDPEFIKNQHQVFTMANKALRDSIDGKQTAADYIEYRNEIAPMSQDELAQ